jgi:outer membrane receptor for ferrienterochelin and colicin
MQKYSNRIDNYFLRFCFSVFILCSTLTGFAQSGSIEGVITDSTTHETLVGASVVIEGTNTGAVSDFEGKYALKNVKPGSYNLIFTYISYNRQVIKNVNVAAGPPTNLNAFLSSHNITIKEVEVIQHKLTNTENSVLLEMKESKQVVSGISGELIGKNQDRNAAEVVKRISGVSILDDRFIMIRGLNDRYNTVWLNGAAAPSSETDRKSFSFDIIPASLIDRILVFKTPSPELPSDFAGGAVKIFTKNHTYNKLEINITGGFRPGSTFKSFTGDHSATDWLGFDNGYRQLPANLPKMTSGLTQDQLYALDSKFSNNWILDKHQTFLDKGLGATYSTDFNLFHKDISSISSLSYSNTNTDYNMLRRVYLLTGNQHYEDQQYTNNVRSSAIQNFQISLSPGNTIVFNNLFNQMGRNRYTFRKAIDESGLELQDQHAIWYQSRTVYNAQLIGTHSLNEKKTDIDWLLGYSFSRKNEPDLRRAAYSVTERGDSILHGILTPASGQVDITRAGRLYQKLSEGTYTAALNLKHDVTIRNFKFQVLTGTYQEYKSRDFNARAFGYSPNNSENFQQTLQYLPLNEIFSSQYINPDGFKLLEDPDPTYKYTATNFLSAFYASGNFSLWKKLDVSGGVRFEHNVQEISSSLNFDPIDKTVTTNFLLPSVNVSYNFTEKSLLRGAYGKSVNRPEFRENAPFNYYDFENLATILGHLYEHPNSPLKVATIQNYDLRYEFYPERKEIISLAIFYKKFKDPIESVTIPSGGNLVYSYDNAPKAYIYGAELDIRKNLNVLDQLFSSAFFEKMSLVVNAALMKSRVSLDKNVSTDAWSTNRPLQGQSPYLINAGLYYQNDKAGLSLSSVYNVFGPRIIYVGSSDYPDVVEVPRHVLDLNITKRISRTVDITVSGKDMLNQRSIWLQDTNKDSKYDPKTDFILMNYRPGSYYTLSVKFHF